MAYTTIDDPSAYFQALVYAGTGNSASQPTTHTNDGNSDLQPDLIWFKDRGAAYSHYLVDSSRGRAKGLKSDTTAAETTSGSTAWDLVSFDTDGFKVGFPSEGNSTNGGTTSKVAWQWKANGGTTSSNTDGNTTTTVQANQDAGFSIVTYTGTGSSSQTMGHGLGVTPNIVLTKARSGTSNWSFNGNFGGMTYGTNRLLLNTSAALTADTNEVTAASSTTFTGGGSSGVNSNGSTFVAYCFAEKQGYSKFGKYVGNGSSTNGTFIYTGFKPAFVMVKGITSNGYHWRMHDSTRDPFNVSDKRLTASSSDAEGSGSSNYYLDILSNGFKWRTNFQTNVNGLSYIYMAFAENPFVTSTGIPTTAR